jgi:predicted RNase H-like HicB family nuclease
VHREGNLYIAYCPQLGTVSQGATPAEAVANLKEATELYLDDGEGVAPDFDLLPSG